MKVARILVVENEPLLQPILDVCGAALPDMTIETCPATESAQHHIRTMDYTVIISPLMTARIDGLVILHEATRIRPRTPVLLLANPQEWQASRTDLIEGAYDVLIKPVDHDMLFMALRRAAGTHALRWGDQRASKQDCIVVVEGLTNQATAQLIKLLFTPYGKVVWCRLVIDSNAPAFAYVELESPSQARHAMEHLGGRTVLGYPLKLSPCRDTLDRRWHS